MADVTRILSQVEQGDPSAAEDLLPLVYEELRRLAAVRMATESPDQTLQATALVHEAYLRLVDVEKVRHWSSRGHFFAAAAEAMRRILVDSARRKNSLKRGAGMVRRDLVDVPAMATSDDILSLDEALRELSEIDETAARLVELRYFGGLTTEEAAAAMGVSVRTAGRIWAYARSWLFTRLHDE